MADKEHAEPTAEERWLEEKVGATARKLPLLAMPARSELRIRAALDRELTGNQDFGPVLTVEQLARYLQVPTGDIHEQLEELPAFEFAGEVRFLRASIDEWIHEREKRFRRQLLETSVRTDRILRLA